MEEEPTTLGKLRTNIAGRAAAALDVLNDFKQKVATHLTTAETAATQAKTHATNAESQLTAATNSAAAVSKLETDATTTFGEFSTVMDEAMDEKTGVAVQLKGVVDTNKRAGELREEISGYRDESLTMKNDISSNKDESQQIHAELETILSESNDTKEKIQKTYKLATDAGLAGALAQRKSELTTQAYVWLGLSILAMAVTIGIIIALFSEITKSDQPANIILSKLFFVSPSAIFALFAITQYRNERRLLEEYAFKAAMANSLESYTELLSREFSDPTYQQQILDFVLPVMKDIYDRAALVAPKLTFNWSLGSKLAKLEATVKEEASGITQQAADAKDELSSQLSDVVNEVKEVTTPISDAATAAKTSK